MLTDDGSVARLADLGLAGRMDDHGQVPNALNPTLYTPPEWFADGLLRRQSDLYPVGLMLRELVAGAFPYEEYTTLFISERLALQQSPLRGKDMTLPIWTPRDLRRVIRKAEARDWRQRYETAAAMDAALARTEVADWREVSELRWETPRRHHPGQAVGVGARALRKGRVRLSILQYRTSWRRVDQDVDVDTLDSVEGRAVFDRATSIAATR